MKTIQYVSFVLLLFVGMSMNAQEKSLTKKQNKKSINMNKKENHFKRMQKTLSLTDDQVQKMQNIKTKRAEEIQKLRGEIKQLKQEERKEMQEVLTPEQREKMKEMRVKRKEAMEKKGFKDGHNKKRGFKKMRSDSKK